MDKFADYMVKDAKTGECYRADHLLKGESNQPSLHHSEDSTEPHLDQSSAELSIISSHCLQGVRFHP